MAIAPTTTCITNSIILQPGTSFILPPGSTILGSSNISGLTSACADLTKLEQTECYGLLFAGFANNQSGPTQYSDDSSQFIRGYRYNNVYTEFSTPIINNNANGSFNMEDLRNRLVSMIGGIVSTNIGYKIDQNGNHRNSISMLTIKTFPSIANSLEIRVNNDAPIDGPNTSGTAVEYLVRLIKMSDYISQGYVGLPTCP